MWISVHGFRCGLVLLGFGVDRCWFLWSLSGNVMGFGVSRQWRFGSVVGQRWWFVIVMA